jgi:hypothetical protein
MAAESAQGEPDEQRLLAEVVAILAQVAGESAEWLAQVGPASRLEGDLYLNSLEVAALGGLLHAAHGDRVDLPAYLAGLDIDQIIALTVGDLLAYVAAVGPAPSRARWRQVPRGHAGRNAALNRHPRSPANGCCRRSW